MTQHNIAGSEALKPSAHVLVRMPGARRRRRAMHPGLKLCLIVAPVGVPLALLDAWLQAPVGISGAIIALVAWRFWPSR